MDTALLLHALPLTETTPWYGPLTKMTPIHTPTRVAVSCLLYVEVPRSFPSRICGIILNVNRPSADLLDLKKLQ